MTTLQLLELLAEDADTASRPAGPCRICSRAILSGDRYARLVPSGQLAHLLCIGRMAATPRRRVPVIR
jgi:hypothetical protein